MLFLLLLLILVFCFGLVFFLTKQFGFRGVTYTLAFSEEEVCEGDTVTLTETICSRKMLPVPWLKAELTTHSALEFARAQSSISEETRFLSSWYFLRPYRKIERHWQVKCTKRGVYTVSHAVLVISDLLGTYEASKPFPEAEAHLRVLPAPIENQAIPSLSSLCMMGETILERRFLPDRFAVSGIRAYAEGDNLRDLCQTATARMGEPMVYCYQDTADPQITLLLDLCTKPYDIDRATDRHAYEQAIRLCCTYILEAQAKNIPISFAANTTLSDAAVQSEKACGDVHGLRLRRMLAALPDTIHEPISRMLLRAVSEAYSGVIVLVTANLSEELIRFAQEYPQLIVVSVRPCKGDQLSQNVISASLT